MMIQSIPKRTFFTLLSTFACVSLARAFFISTKKCGITSQSRLNLQRGNYSVLSLAGARGPSKRLAAVPAKKRRRRRQDDSTGGDETPQESDSLILGDGLPDFDLGGTDGDKQQKSPARQRSPDEITPLMMGDANKAVRSVKELISDRSLESKFEFDDKGDPSIPDFTELARASASRLSSSSPSMQNDGSEMGKKKQRQAERQAEAIKAQANKEKEKNPLDGLPFVTNEAGKFSPIKLLESGGMYNN